KRRTTASASAAQATDALRARLLLRAMHLPARRAAQLDDVTPRGLAPPADAPTEAREHRRVDARRRRQQAAAVAFLRLAHRPSPLSQQACDSPRRSAIARLRATPYYCARAASTGGTSPRSSWIRCTSASGANGFCSSADPASRCPRRTIVASAYPD